MGYFIFLDSSPCLTPALWLSSCRLKLVPRVVNVEEWVVRGPLSMSEAKLLNSYNEKPILTRPQVGCPAGPCKCAYRLLQGGWVVVA